MITVQSRPESIVVFPSGHLGLDRSFSLRHVIGQVLEPGLNVVIDLRHVLSVDAEGLSALAGSARRVRAVGGTACVANANPRVRWLLGLIGLERYIAASPEPSSSGTD
jgi:anti-anti-sigma factor